jgi:hypothetical protein
LLWSATIIIKFPEFSERRFRESIQIANQTYNAVDSTCTAGEAKIEHLFVLEIVDQETE